MKNLLFVALFALPVAVSAQITLTNADMPDAGDGYVTATALDFLTVDFSATGANQTWDYTGLIADSVNIDTFVTVGSTPLFYNFLFNSPFDQTHQADFAQPIALPDSLLGFEPTDVYGYYKVTGSQYQYVGFGATLNGIPLPTTYTPVDVVYRFPLDYNDVDSSDSAFEFNIPNIGYYGQELHRVNTVDGWGTLQLPIGDFECLRVRSELTYRDTIALDTLGGGFAIDRPLTIEYKWLAAGQGVPLLQINTTTVLTVETANRVLFRTVRPTDAPNAISESALSGRGEFVPQLYPNPAAEEVWLVIHPAHSGETVSVFSLEGRLVLQQNNTQSISRLDLSGLEAGVYLVQIGQGEPVRLVVQ